MSPSPPVVRAPLRSRNHTVDHAAAVTWALAHDVCGVGGRLRQDAGELEHAVELVTRAYDERVGERLRRFAELPEGTFVWTRTPDGPLRLGRLVGPWYQDRSSEAHTHDLTHLRPCTWLPEPVEDDEAPAAVRQTFDRGGRNLQRIRPTSALGDVEAETAALWDDLAGDA